MKKSTLAAMIAYLNNDASVNADELKATLTEEWNRLNGAVEAKQKERKEIAKAVLAYMAGKEPQTAHEIFKGIDLPEDYSERALMWLLSHDLKDKVKKHENGRNPFKYSL